MGSVLLFVYVKGGVCVYLVVVGGIDVLVVFGSCLIYMFGVIGGYVGWCL